MTATIEEKESPAEAPGSKMGYVTPYTLSYKAVHNVGSCNFMGPVELMEAIELGTKYCRQRHWRFIQVRPLFVDILATPQTEEERAKYA